MKSEFRTLQRAIRYYARLQRLIPGGRALPPLMVTFVLTARCTHACSNCFVQRACRRGASADELSPELWQDILSQLPPWTVVSLTGGEPLERPDFDAIFRQVSNRNPCLLETNGAQLVRRIQSLLIGGAFRPARARGLVAVSFSIGCPEQLHERTTGVPGSFQQTIDGIRRLQREKRASGSRFPMITLRTVITPDILPRLEELVHLAKELDIERVILCPEVVLDDFMVPGSTSIYELSPPSVPQIDPVELRNQLDRMYYNQDVFVSFLGATTPRDAVEYYRDTPDKPRRTCYFPRSRAAVSPTGELAVCTMHWVGSLQRSRFAELWNGDAAHRFRQDLDRVKTFPACVGCCHSAVEPEGWLASLIG